MNKTSHIFLADSFKLELESGTNETKTILMGLRFPEGIVSVDAATSKKTARQLANQLRDAADWVDEVWK